MLARPYYRHHSHSVQCPLTTSSQHQLKREALVGKSEQGRDLTLADGDSYRGPRVTTLPGRLTAFELAEKAGSYRTLDGALAKSGHVGHSTEASLLRIL